MSDMTNAEAAKVLNYLIDKYFLEDDWREAFKTALAALTPKVDEHGHALCGCGNKAKLEHDSYGWYHILCSACDMNGSNSTEAELVWDEWDTAMGLRRDA